jgi:flagellar biosynthetic protein FliQ
MTPDMVIDVGEQALRITTLLAAPVLTAALVVGLIIGMFQAATQINETTLSFVPKLLAMVVALFFAGPWMLDVLISFTRGLIERIPEMIG